MILIAEKKEHFCKCHNKKITKINYSGIYNVFICPVTDKICEPKSKSGKKNCS